MKTEANPLLTLNVNHGHESLAHRNGKLETADVFLGVGFHLIFFEKGCCDVVAVRRVNGALETIGAEIENSSRHVIQNIRRDLGKVGCNGVIVATPDFKTLAAVARKLSRELPIELHHKVGVTSLNTLKMLVPKTK